MTIAAPDTTAIEGISMEKEVVCDAENCDRSGQWRMSYTCSTCGRVSNFLCEPHKQTVQEELVGAPFVTHHPCNESPVDMTSFIFTRL